MGDETMDNQQERPLSIDLAWLGGMWEADGSVSLFNNKCSAKYKQYEPVMQFVNTDILIAKEVMRILGRIGVGYYQFTRIQTGLGTKLRYEIRIAGFKRCSTFLRYMIPYMVGCKKQRSALIKKFIDYRLSLPIKAKYGEIEYQIYEEYAKYNESLDRESSTTNMPDTNMVKIESELLRDK
jgi:hypothetical protein